MVLVKDVMSRNLMYLKPNDFVTKARGIMREYGYRALPVIENKKLVGIVSRTDVLKITSSKANIEISGIMQRNVISVSPDDDLFSAGRKIISNGIRQLPVVKDDEPIGIISGMDILKGIVKNKYKPILKKVKDVMTSKVIYCSENDELSRVWDKIQEYGFSGLPVVFKEKVVGIITRSDIIKHGSFRLSKESGKVKNITVKKLMKSPPIVVEPETKISKSAKLIIKERISRLPVVENKEKFGKLLGIIDVEDILRAYITGNRKK